MRFKRLLNSQSLSTLMIAAAVSFSACSFKVNEEVPGEEARQLGGTKLNCLVGSQAAVKNYFYGEGTDESIAAVFDCMSDSLKLFVERTRGAELGKYKPSELRKFLSKYFLDGEKISDQLITEFSELKRALVGGSADAITVVEIDKVRGIFQTLKTQALLLRPFMPLTPQHLADQPTSRVNAATTALITAANTLGTLISQTGVSYSFSRLESLLFEIEAFSQLDSAKTLRNRIQTFRALKAIAIAPPMDRITSSEWTRALSLGSQWYAIMIRLTQMNRQSKNLMIGSDRAQLYQIVETAKNLILDSVRNHPENTITFNELESLIQSIAEEEIPFGFKASTLSHFIETMGRKIFAGYQTGEEGRDARGITVAHLDRVFESFQMWNFQQEILEKLWIHSGDSTFEGEGFKRDQLVTQNDEFWGRYLSTGNSVQERAAQDLRVIIETNRPMFYKKEFRIYAPKFSEEPVFTFFNLSQLNWMRRLSAFLLQGYAGGLDRAQRMTGLTLQEFTDFCHDIKNLGYETKLIEDQTLGFISSRFRESNLFVYAADGDSLLSLNEVSQLLGYLMAASDLTSRIQEVVLKDCKGGTIDGDGKEYGYPHVEQNCYYKSLTDHIADIVSDDKPNLSNYLKSMDAPRREAYLRIVMKAAVVPNRPYVWKTDTESLAGLMNYIESLFTKFDEDGSGTLNKKEGDLAYRLFRNELMNDLPTTTSERVRNSIFTFLLANGRSPDPSQYEGFFKKAGETFNFLWWIIAGKSKAYEADREKVMNILIALYESMNPTPKPEL